MASEPLRILVTGGAGFIGSALVRHLVGETDHEVLNFDKLTYAGTLTSVEAVADNPRYRFLKGDVCDMDAVTAAICEFCPDVITHLAAESHVDRSIDAPDAFIQTNLVGTYRLLMAVRAFWQSLSIQGWGRPSRKRLGAHFRTAGPDYKLLEQLRTLSLSRKAHSADCRQGARRRAASGLWQGRSGARLALRGRPCPGTASGSGTRPARTDLQRRRKQPEAEHRGRPRRLPNSRPACAAVRRNA